MSRNTLILMAVASTIVAIGCTPSPKKARHTVEEYLADDALRKEQVALCANDPGSIGDTPDCINARTAEARAGRGSFSKRFRPNPFGAPSTGGAKDQPPSTQNSP